MLGRCSPFVAGSLIGLILVAVVAPAAIAQSISTDEARAIARDAAIYGFPLVDNYRIQYSYFVDRNNPDYKAPWNTINNVVRVFTPEDQAIQTPNADTPYSQLGADLRRESLVISVPDWRPRHWGFMATRKKRLFIRPISSTHAAKN